MKQILILKSILLFITLFNQFLIAQNQDSTEFEQMIKKKYNLKIKDFKINFQKPEFFYTGCRNRIDCSFVERKMRKYPIVVSATACIVIPISNLTQGLFELFPASKMTTITISTKIKGDGITIMSYEIPCKIPPKPELYLFQNGIIWNENVTFNSKDTIFIHLIPDKIFEEKLPSESNYKMSNIQISIDNELVEVIPECEVSSKPILPINILKYNLKIGQELKIVVGDVFRLNSEKIPLENRTFVLKL